MHSKTVVIGTAHFTMEEMIASRADERGLKRVSGDVLNPETRKPMGKIKIAYKFEVERKQLPNEPRTRTNVDNSTLYDVAHPHMAHHLHQHQRYMSPSFPSASILQEASYVSRHSVGGGNKSYMSHSRNPNQQQMMMPYRSQMSPGTYFAADLDDEMDPFAEHNTNTTQVLLPCSFTLHSLSTMELTPVSAFKKNMPAIKVFCDNFYQITEVS